MEGRHFRSGNYFKRLRQVGYIAQSCVIFITGRPGSGEDIALRRALKAGVFSSPSLRE